MLIKRLSKQYKGLLQPLRTFAFYFAWVWAFKLLILSFVTFFMLPEAGRLGKIDAPLPRFEEISDVLGANELPLIGLGSFLFVAFLRALHPLTSTTNSEVFLWDRVKKLFPAGCLHGFTLALGIVLAFLFSGIYGFFGFSLQADELALALPGLFLRTSTIIFFVYCEEFIFRKKILFKILETIPEDQSGRVETGVLLTSILYCAVKMLQFDLGISQTLTLFILSITLSYKALVDGDFSRGTGFWATILVLFQPLFGLPIFGTEFSGIFLVKYQTTQSPTSQFTNYLTGGAAGPLSSLAFQFLLALDLARSIFNKKFSIFPLFTRDANR